jgi:hypothetical protein
MVIGAELDTKTEEEVLSHYADGGNRTREIAGFLLVVLGVLFFLWFLSLLRSRLRSAEPETTTLSTLGFGAGTTAAALVIGGTAMVAGTALTVDLVDGFEIDPDRVWYGVGVGYLFLLGWVLVACVLVAATSVLAVRTAVFPNWLGWIGFAAVVLAVVEAFLFPVFTIPLWMVIVSVVMMTHAPVPRPQTSKQTAQA